MGTKASRADSLKQFSALEATRNHRVAKNLLRAKHWARLTLPCQDGRSTNRARSSRLAGYNQNLKI